MAKWTFENEKKIEPSQFPSGERYIEDSGIVWPQSSEMAFGKVEIDPKKNPKDSPLVQKVFVPKVIPLAGRKSQNPF